MSEEKVEVPVKGSTKNKKRFSFKVKPQDGLKTGYSLRKPLVSGKKRIK